MPIPITEKLNFGDEVKDRTGIWKVIRDNGDVVDVWNGISIGSLIKLEIEVVSHNNK